MGRVLLATQHGEEVDDSRVFEIMRMIIETLAKKNGGELHIPKEDLTAATGDIFIANHAQTDEVLLIRAIPPDVIECCHHKEEPPNSTE